MQAFVHLLWAVERWARMPKEVLAGEQVLPLPPRVFVHVILSFVC